MFEPVTTIGLGAIAICGALGLCLVQSYFFPARKRVYWCSILSVVAYIVTYYLYDVPGFQEWVKKNNDITNLLLPFYGILLFFNIKLK